MRNAYSFVFAVSFAVWGAAGCAPAERDEAKAESERPAALVTVAPVEAGTIRQSWSFLGEVRARARAEVAAGADGTVTRVTVREGDRIQTGQLLLEVDPALAAARNDLTAAEAARVRELLEQAQRDLERVDGLSNRAVSRAEVERARSNVSALRSELEARKASAREARALYLRHLVRAPFDGVVARRSVDLGDWVTPGQPVLELVSTGELDILVNVSPALLRSIVVGDSVQIRGRAQSTATVVAIVPALDPVARTSRVRLEPESGAEWLLPGSTVDVTFQVNPEEGGVVVPRDAVIESKVGARVVRLIGETVENVNVRVLARSNDQVLVVGEDLERGQRVVVRGNERLRPGQKVRVADESSAAGGRSPSNPLASPDKSSDSPRGG